MRVLFIWAMDTLILRLSLRIFYDRTEPYDLGECEFHLAFRTDEYDRLHELHSEMGVIAFENPEVGVYFITDPDGYWIENTACKDRTGRWMRCAR